MSELGRFIKKKEEVKPLISDENAAENIAEALEAFGIDVAKMAKKDEKAESELEKLLSVIEDDVMMGQVSFDLGSDPKIIIKRSDGEENIVMRRPRIGAVHITKRMETDMVHRALVFAQSTSGLSTVLLSKLNNPDWDKVQAVVTAFFLR